NLAFRASTCYTRMVIAPDAFRRALGHFATGVTVVTTCDSDGRPTGLTASAFSSVSLDPPLVLVCVDHKAQSYPALLEPGRFAVYLLPRAVRSPVRNEFVTPSVPLTPGPLSPIPLSRPPIDDEIKQAVLAAIDSRQYILGPQCRNLEAELATHTGTEHAVLTSS